MSAKEVLYAAIGAGELALDKARSAGAKVMEIDYSSISTQLPGRLSTVRHRLEEAGIRAASKSGKSYRTLVKRGEKTVRNVRRAAPTQRAVSQAKVARRQTKAAVTSAQKAAATTAEAVKEAASSV